MAISQGKTQSLKVLIDTNIVLDVALERSPFFSTSLSVFTLANNKRISAFISASTVSDLYYIIRKIKGHEATITFLRIIINLFKIATVDQDIIQASLNLGFKDFEDAIQYQVAINNQFDAIVTRNAKDFPSGIINILTPQILIAEVDQS